MQKIKWWADLQLWPKSIKAMAYGGFFVVIVLLVLSCFWYYNGLSNVTHWDIVSQLAEKYVTSQVLSIGGLDFQLPEKVFYLKEFYTPSAMQTPFWVSYVFLTCTVLGLVYVLAGLANRGGLYFLLGVLAIASFCLFLRLENVLGFTANWPFLLAFVSLGGLLYYVANFKPYWSIRWRFSVFALAFAVMFGLIFLLSKSTATAQALSSFGVLFAIGISLLFIFWVGQEIFVMVLALVGRTAIKGKSSLSSYGIVSVILILNFLLVYLENAKYISESVFIFNPLFLLVFAGFVGFWGLYKYSEDTEAFSFQQTGLWMYLGSFTITFAGIGYCIAAGNDPLIDFYKDYISAVFLVLTISLFFHGLVNFSDLMRQGYDVYKIFWKPKVSRLFLAKLGAVFLLTFAISQKNFFMYDQVRAGLAIFQADFYKDIGEMRAAETFYKEAILHDVYNHKANYALASIAKEKGDPANASFFYRQATARVGSPHAFIGLSQNLQSSGRFFDALFTLKEGQGAFPQNAAIHTNLGHLMEQAKQQDSTFIYQDIAYDLCYNCKVEATNLLSFWLQNGKKDSIRRHVNDIGPFDYTSFKANELAVNLVAGVVDSTIRTFDVKPLSVADFSHLYNYVNGGGKLKDSLLRGLQEHQYNNSFAQDIAYLRALNEYSHGSKLRAIKSLSQLIKGDNNEAIRLKKKLAIWYLDQGLLKQSLRYFSSAGDSVTVEAMTQSNLSKTLRQRAEIQSFRLIEQGITLQNYELILQEAPLNLYVNEKVSDFLVSKEKYLEAYNLWNELSEFYPESAVVWKQYALLALKNGVKEYAYQAQKKLQVLLRPGEFEVFSKEFDRGLSALEGNFE